MNRLNKNKSVKNKASLQENTSPVCYLESDELRPEYRSNPESEENKKKEPKPEKWFFTIVYNLIIFFRKLFSTFVFIMVSNRKSY